MFCYLSRYIVVLLFNSFSWFRCSCCCCCCYCYYYFNWTLCLTLHFLFLVLLWICFDFALLLLWLDLFWFTFVFAASTCCCFYVWHIFALLLPPLPSLPLLFGGAVRTWRTRSRCRWWQCNCIICWVLKFDCKMYIKYKFLASAEKTAQNDRKKLRFVFWRPRSNVWSIKCERNKQAASWATTRTATTTATITLHGTWLTCFTLYHTYNNNNDNNNWRIAVAAYNIMAWTSERTNLYDCLLF